MPLSKPTFKHLLRVRIPNRIFQPLTWRFNRFQATESSRAYSWYFVPNPIQKSDKECWFSFYCLDSGEKSRERSSPKNKTLHINATMQIFHFVHYTGYFPWQSHWKKYPLPLYKMHKSWMWMDWRTEGKRGDIQLQLASYVRKGSLCWCY